MNKRTLASITCLSLIALLPLNAADIEHFDVAGNHLDCDDDCNDDSDDDCHEQLLTDECYEPDYDDNYEPDASWPSRREDFIDEMENEY
jgi:hypothetical protein